MCSVDVLYGELKGMGYVGSLEDMIVQCVEDERTDVTEWPQESYTPTADSQKKK